MKGAKRSPTLAARASRVGKGAGPVKDKTDVVRDRGADVFDDERSDLFGMECGELEGVDAAQGVAEKDGAGKVKVRKEGFKVGEVVGSGVRGSVIGVTVAALIEGDNTPVGCERRSQRGESCGLHEMSMEGDEGVVANAGIEIGEREPGVLERVALEVHDRSDGTWDGRRRHREQRDCETKI